MHRFFYLYYEKILDVFDLLKLNISKKSYKKYILNLKNNKNQYESSDILLLAIIPLLKSKKVRFKKENPYILIHTVIIPLFFKEKEFLIFYKNSNLEDILKLKNIEVLKIYSKYLYFLNKEKYAKDILKIEIEINKKIK